MIKTITDIDRLSPDNFEVFVKELFEASGWTNAVITKVGKEFRHGDGGVDIYAYKSKRKFAIEVKQRNINTTVDVKALNQLVTGAKLSNTSNMILVTNSYFTSEVMIRALRLGVELVDRDELQNLWVKKHSEIGRDIKPRKYQRSVIEESITQFKLGKSKILIEMATGLGKTYTASLLIKNIIQIYHKRPKVLFLAHQVEILLQSVTAFKNVLGIGNYSFSACFSGSEPEDTDFVFASFDTLYNQLHSMSKEHFDFVIVDEAHHTPARTYSAVVDNFKPQLLIGLTATPYRADNKSVLDFFGGTEGHIGKYDLAWALRHRKLAFPKYLVLLDDLDQSKIDQLDSGLSITDLDKRLFLHKKDKEVVKIIEQKIKEKNIKEVKGIVFCRSITHIKYLIGFFEVGTATLVHSKMTDLERRHNIRSFREGSARFILVCDLFNEGIDIPETNLLVFMRYTGSKTIWLQQLGRGLRKTPNKEYVHVLDFVGSIERLNEIRELSNSVKRIKVDRESLGEHEDSYNDSSEIVHDGTLDVAYSASAAKVLELIESLKYRLNSRERLLDKLRDHYDEFGSLPNIEELQSEIKDVSLDQIATHFDSYYGYISCAFGRELYNASYKDRVANYYLSFCNRNGVKPSPRAISIQFTHMNLPEFTELEVAHFINDIKFSEKDKSDDINSLHEKDEKKVNESLLERYFNIIKTRRDLKRLKESEMDEIRKSYRSASLFLKKLNDYRGKDA